MTTQENSLHFSNTLTNKSRAHRVSKNHVGKFNKQQIKTRNIKIPVSHWHLINDNHEWSTGRQSKFSLIFILRKMCKNVVVFIQKQEEFTFMTLNHVQVPIHGGRDLIHHCSTETSVYLAKKLGCQPCARLTGNAREQREIKAKSGCNFQSIQLLFL